MTTTDDIETLAPPRLAPGAVLTNPNGGMQIMVHLKTGPKQQLQLGSLFIEPGDRVAYPVVPGTDRTEKPEPTETTRYVGGICPNPGCLNSVARKLGQTAPLCSDCQPAPGQESPSLGMKFDSEKPRFDLLLEGLPRALEEVTKVLTFGSRKYADHNWQFVDRPQQRYLAASTRHELALQRGETHDPETGLHHLAHKLCCDLFRLELSLRGD